MECPAMHLAARGSNELLRAREHLLRGATSKREKKNSVRPHSALDEVRYAVDESAGLSCSGACDDEQRPVAVRRCGGLLGIQLRCESPRLGVGHGPFPGRVDSRGSG